MLPLFLNVPRDPFAAPGDIPEHLLHHGLDVLVGDDLAIGINAVAADMVDMAMGVDQVLEIIAPELLGDDLAESLVELGDVGGIDHHDAFLGGDGADGGR
ncbi:MAG: hypothetical protein MUF02_09415 [Acidobacteria bacterium]|nr:hypothetical protein [Acidobacteriota bacterium]